MTGTSPSSDTERRDYLRYRADFLLGRQEMDDSTLWQAPGLALAAQAFLLAIALANQATRFSRITTSWLAFCASLAAIYLIARKGFQRKVAEAELKEIVLELYPDKVFPVQFKDHIENLPSNGPRLPMYLGLEAPTVWAAALGIFALLDVAIILMAIIKSPFLGTY